ncbi:MAG TPA: EamA family transporter [Candidatus Eisenbacteria bacterium]|nr:EamA family transporter [Candidatus Eisenbacteria bacterium]
MDAPRHRRWKIALAFACIYLIWGSTYLAIRFVVETLPPLGTAGVRFLIAGAGLYGWLAWRGEMRRVTLRHWKSAAILGSLFFLGGNGGVCWAETRVPSGLTALVIATVPLWIVGLDWVRPGGSKPKRWVLAGAALGILGVALLVSPGTAHEGIDPLGALVLLLASGSWALGTVTSRHLDHPGNHLTSTAMQMIGGGAALLLASAVTGEIADVSPSGVSSRSIAAFVYLILAGSLVGFSAYNWLLQVMPPATVGTYAFVNPGIAVLLGWAVAGEPVTGRILLAGGMIVVAVALIVTRRR